jgi:DNA-binding NarL/FixJ family response regulator
MAQISLAVIDSQRTFADALAERLSAEVRLRVVAATDSVVAANRLLVGRHVDVALLDAELPDGLPFATRARAAAPHPIRVIMLGTTTEAIRIVDTLRAGVAGWVGKGDSIEHLLEVIQGVVHDEIWLPPTAMGPVLRLLLDDRSGRPGSGTDPLVTLTSREREVLSHLAQGMGRREVADHMHLSPNTVRSHMQNLMGKLKVHTTLEAVALARRAQLRDTASNVGACS